VGDAESVASLTGIENNLLPYWLTQFPNHPLEAIEVPDEAGRQVRAYGEAGDEMALRIFDQQAMALGRLFTIAANYTDPTVYFLGGGVVESTPAFRDWFMGKVRENTVLRDEQTRLASFAVVPDLDMAGARALLWRLWPRFGDSQATLFTDSSRPHNSLIGCRQICQFRRSEPSLNECRC
jgi:glucokinase